MGNDLSAPDPPSGGDDRLRQGRLAFNRGQFFAAHELWEEVWRERSGAERGLLQGLIQVAAACHHLQGGRSGPAARLLAKGISRMSAGAVAAGGDAPVLFVDCPLPAFIDRVRHLKVALAEGRGPPLSDPATLKL